MAGRTINTQIRVTGEKEFNNAMKAINANLRVLGSSLAATEAEFRVQGASVASLSAKLQAQKALYNEQTKGIKELEKAMAAADKGSETYKNYEISLNKAKTAHANLKGEINRTEAELKKAETAARATAGGMRNLGDSTEGTARGMTVLGVAAGNILSELAKKGVETIKTLAETGISYNAQIEKYTTAMTTALGSATAAAAAIENIQRDAALTPFGMNGLTQANMLLITTGESAEDARATINALSEAVAATGGGDDELQRMAYNLQQIKNVGKAAAIDIKQFGYAGIDVFGILSDYTGKNRDEIKGMEINYELLTAALRAAAAEGGRYFGANIAMSKTLNGQLATLSDNVKIKLGEAFSGVTGTLQGTLLPAANRFVEDLDVQKITDDFENLITVTAAFGGTIAAIKAAEKILDLTTGIRAATVAMEAYRKTTGNAQLQQAVLNGQLSLGQIALNALSGQLTAATVKQLALNAATAAFPGAIILGAGILVANFANMLREGAEEAKAFKEAIMAETDLSDLEAVRAKIEELREELRLTLGLTKEEFNANPYTTDTIVELEEIARNLENVAAAEAAYAETADGRAEKLKTDLEDLKKQYEELRSEALKSLEEQHGLFEAVDAAVIRTKEDMLTAQQTQTDYWASYGENLNYINDLTASNISINSELISLFASGTEEGASAAASFVEQMKLVQAGGTEALQGVADEYNSSVEATAEARNRLAGEIAAMQTEFETKLGEMEAAANALAEDMDVSDEMTEAGTNSIEAFIKALDALEGPLASKGASMATQFSAAFNSAINLNVPTLGGGGISGNLNALLPGHASGLDYVPYDNYRARLHRGEMVLNAREAELLRKTGSINGTGQSTRIATVNIYPQSLDKAQTDYIVHLVNEELGKI